MIALIYLIWFVSAVLATNVAIKKGVKPSFWAYVFIFAPIVNTYIAIRYFRVDTSGFSKFWKKLSGFSEFLKKLNENNDRK